MLLVPFHREKTLSHKGSVPWSKSQSKYLGKLGPAPQLGSKSLHDAPGKSNAAPKVPKMQGHSSLARP